jgi:hypothetical protein
MTEESPFDFDETLTMKASHNVYLSVSGTNGVKLDTKQLTNNISLPHTALPPGIVRGKAASSLMRTKGIY